MESLIKNLILRDLEVDKTQAEQYFFIEAPSLFFTNSPVREFLISIEGLPWKDGPLESYPFFDEEIIVQYYKHISKNKIIIIYSKRNHDIDKL